MRIRVALSCALIVVMFLPACGSLLGENHVNFISYPEGAEVMLDGKSVGKTPCTVKVPFSWGKGDVELSREGHRDVQAAVRRQFNTFYLLNILFPPGLLIDLMTGGVRESVTYVVVDFDKELILNLDRGEGRPTREDGGE